MGSRTYTTVDTDTTTTTNNIDRRVAVTDGGSSFTIDGDLSGGIAISNTSNSIDGGAISGALQIGRDAVAEMGKLPGIFTGIHKDNTAFLSGVAKQISDTYDGYQRNLAGAYDNFSTGLRANASDAFNFSRSSLDNTLNFGRDILAKSDRDTQNAVSAVKATSERLLTYITESEKDPNERGFQNALPWLVGGAVIIAVFAFGSKARA